MSEKKFVAILKMDGDNITITYFAKTDIDFTNCKKPEEKAKTNSVVGKTSNDNKTNPNNVYERLYKTKTKSLGQPDIKKKDLFKANTNIGTVQQKRKPQYKAGRRTKKRNNKTKKRNNKKSRKSKK